MSDIVTFYSSPPPAFSTTPLFLKAYTPRQSNSPTNAIPTRMSRRNLVSTSQLILRTAEMQGSGPELSQMQTGRPSLSDEGAQETPENISTVLSFKLNTIFRSTIQLAPSRKRSRASKPKQASPLRLFLSRKQRSGNQETTLPLIWRSKLGKMSRRVCLRVLPGGTSSLTHFKPAFLAILHCWGWQAQLFSTSCRKRLYSRVGKQVKVEPESMNRPQKPREEAECSTVSFMLIRSTPYSEYRLRSELNAVLTASFPFVISQGILPMASNPPFLARHIENRNCSPVWGLCFSQSRSRRRALRVGASPKMPLAAWVQKRLVSRMVHPKVVVMASPLEAGSNWMESSMRMPERELPSAQDMRKVQASLFFWKQRSLHKSCPELQMGAGVRRS